MSAPNYKAKDVASSVKVLIGTIQVPVSSLMLYQTINQIPYAEMSIQLDNKPSSAGVAAIGGVEININTISQLSKVLQEKFYNSFSLLPDVTITMNDDNVPGNNDAPFIFKGFLSDPKVAIRSGQFYLNCTVIHSMARLQAFNPQLYFATAMYASQQDPIQQGFSDNIAVRDDSIANRVLVGITELMTQYSEQWTGINDPKVDAEAFKTSQSQPWLYEPAQWNMHILNKAVLDAVTQVLKASAPLTIIDNLVKATLAREFSEENLHKTILEIMANSPNMLVALTNLIQPFMFQMNSTWADTLWIEHLQTMEPPQSMLVLPFDAASFNLASAFELPLLQVIVRGPGSEFYASSPMATDASLAPIYPQVASPMTNDLVVLYDQSGRVLGRYPTQIPRKADGSPIPGRYLYVDAPAWISNDFQNLIPPIFTPNDETIDATTKLTSSVLKEAQQQFAGIGRSRVGFLNYLAEQTFNDAFLQRATARVRGPLFLKPQIGRTYFVRAVGQEDTVFIAFLQSVTHTISLSPDGATADTEYVFSHVRARYASLTPVSLGNSANGINDVTTMENIANTEKILQDMYDQGITYKQATAEELAAAQESQLAADKAKFDQLVPSFDAAIAVAGV